MKRYYSSSCKVKLLLSSILFFYIPIAFSANNLVAIKAFNAGISYDYNSLVNDKIATNDDLNMVHNLPVISEVNGFIINRGAISKRSSEKNILITEPLEIDNTSNYYQRTIVTENTHAIGNNNITRYSIYLDSAGNQLSRVVNRSLAFEIDGSATYDNLAAGIIHIKDTGSLLLTDNAGLFAYEDNTTALTNEGVIKIGDDSGVSTARISVGSNSYFSNAGVIDLTQKNKWSNNDLVGSKLGIFGHYISNGGSLYLNTVLDDANASGSSGLSDHLSIVGDVSVGSKGATKVYIIPTASTVNSGMLTVGEGILIIGVDGYSAPDAFVLGRPVVAGNYEYILHQSSRSQSWYLSSFYHAVINYNPSIGPYLANQTAAIQMFQQTLFDRLISASDISDDASEQRFWMRTKMAHSSYYSVYKSFGNRTRMYTLQIGGDVDVWALTNGGYFHLGLMGGYGDFKDTTKSDSTKTKANGYVKGYSIGVYGTYFANRDTNIGSYVDMWSQMGLYSNEVSGKAQISTKKYNSIVWSNSIELGYGLPLVISGDYQWLVTPQIQFTYNYYNKKNLTDSNNLRVSNDNANGLETRMGFRFHARGVRESRLEPFLEINWLNTTAKNKLDFNKVAFKDGVARDRVEAKIGLQGNITQKWAISGQMGGQWGDSFHTYQGQFNINYRF